MDRNKICVYHTTKNKHVALRKESVDRNLVVWAVVRVYELVALRKESVDRNHIAVHSVSAALVALRKESVDRNSHNP